MTEDTWGVNYRALNDLFEISNARSDMIKYEVGVQMIEIYNEQVRDLLVSDGSNRRYPFKQQSDKVKIFAYDKNQFSFIEYLYNYIHFLNRLNVRYTKQLST